MNEREELRRILRTVSGAVDDYTANRPIEDVMGEIGSAVDSGLSLLHDATVTDGGDGWLASCPCGWRTPRSIRQQEDAQRWADGHNVRHPWEASE